MLFVPSGLDSRWRAKIIVAACLMFKRPDHVVEAFEFFVKIMQPR